jgi:hypothetical protein
MSNETFDNFEYNPYQSQYVAAPIDELAVLGKTLDDKYNANKALYDENNFIHVNALDKDIPDRNKTLQGYTDQMNQTVKDNNGAYEKIGPQISMVTNRIHKDMTMGKLNAMENNFKSANDYQARIAKLVDSRDIMPDTGNKLIAEAKMNYSGVGDGGQNNIYNHFQGNEPAKEIDPDLEAEKLFTGFQEKSKEGMSYGKGPDGSYGFWKSSTTGFVPKDVKSYISNALAQDPELQASLNQKVRLNNLGITKLEQYVTPNKANELRQAYPGYSDSQIAQTLDKTNTINNTINNLLIKKGAQKTSSNYTTSPWWEKQQEWAHEDGSGSQNPTAPNNLLVNGIGAKQPSTYKDYADYQAKTTDMMKQLGSINEQLNNKDVTPDGRANLLLQKHLLLNNITSAAQLKDKIDAKYKLETDSPAKIALIKSQAEKDWDNGTADSTPYKQMAAESGDMEGAKENYIQSKLTKNQQSIADKYNQEFSDDNNKNEVQVPVVTLPTIPKTLANKVAPSAAEQLTADFKRDPTAYKITDATGNPVDPTKDPSILQNIEITGMYQNPIDGVGRPLIAHQNIEGKADTNGNKPQSAKTYIVVPSKVSNAYQIIAKDLRNYGGAAGQELSANLNNDDIANTVAKFNHQNVSDLTVPITGKKGNDGKYNINDLQIHKHPDGSYTYTSPITGQEVPSTSDNALTTNLINLKNALNSDSYTKKH